MNIRTRNRPWLRRIAAPALLVVIALGVGAAPAAAHSQLVATDPRSGETVPSAPEAVQLTFDAAVEVKLGAVRVYDTADRRVDTGRVTQSNGGTGVRAPLDRDAMRSGTYVVVWRVTSADGHPVQGAYTFNVGAPSASGDVGNDLAARYLAQSGASTAVGVLATIGRTLAFAGLALFIGAALAGALWARPLLKTRTLTSVVWTGLILTTVGTVVALAAQGAYAAGYSFGAVLRIDLLGDVLQTRFGRALAARIVLVIAAFAWWRWMRRSDGRRAAVVVGAGLAVAIALTVSLAGHAATGSLPVIGVLLDLVHVLAVNAWFGGLVVLAFAALREDPVPWETIERFSKLALIAVMVLVVSGSGQAWRQLGSVRALTETDYGQVLLAKVACFALALPFAVYGRELLRRRITPEELEAAQGDPEAQAELESGLDPVVVQQRLRRSVLVETVFIVAAFALTAVLINTVPGREALVGPVYVRMADQQARIDGAIVPARLGPNDVHLTVYTPDGLPTEVNAITAQLTRPDLAPIDIPLRRLTPGHYYSPQFVIPRRGTWTLVVRTDLDAFTRDTQTTTVRIR